MIDGLLRLARTTSTNRRVWWLGRRSPSHLFGGEVDNLPQGIAGFERVHRFVDVGELDVGTNQAIDGQLSIQVHLGVSLNVVGWVS